MSGISIDNPRVKAIKQVMKQHGPLTAKQLAALTGLPRSQVASYLQPLRMVGEKREVYVQRYERSEGEQGGLYPRAVYALGQQKDAPRGIANLTKDQYQLRYRVKTLGQEEVDARRLKRLPASCVWDLQHEHHRRRLGMRG